VLPLLLLLLLLLLCLSSLLLIPPSPSPTHLLLRPWAMSCLLLAICPLHCRSLCPSHCLFALPLLPPPLLQGLSPLLLPLLLLLLVLLLLPPPPPLQPKLRLQLLPGGDGLCP
jgi:hypothetical protein